ncbi:MAG TPA: DUF308 domain-containing protein [Jatrophihabitans sp.]|nr:DUF308 domain-containing protein [Jatrophihabitans sp.]
MIEDVAFVIGIRGPARTPISRTVIAGLVILGVLSLVFGVIAIAWPAVTLLAIAITFGVYAVLAGATMIAAGALAWVPNRVSSVLLGILDVIAGIVAIGWPSVTVVVLAVVVGVWAIMTGVLELVLAVRLRRAAPDRGMVGWAVFSGLLAVVVGVLILARPVAGAFGIALLVGVYALIYAGHLFALAWQLHRVRAGRLEPVGTEPREAEFRPAGRMWRHSAG